MQQHLKPAYPDYLLLHGRQSRRLNIEQVCAKTGITAENYKQMEAGAKLIDITDAELLGALFKINPQYIEEHNFQLTLLSSSKHIIQMKEAKIISLTKALKRKIKQSL